MSIDTLGIAHKILDAQIVDSDGRRCGRVDDVELKGTPGEPLYVVALLSGRGVWADRLPKFLRSIARRLFADPNDNQTVIRISWEHVDALGKDLKLTVPGPQLGLGEGDHRVPETFQKIPGN